MAVVIHHNRWLFWAVSFLVVMAIILLWVITKYAIEQELSISTWEVAYTIKAVKRSGIENANCPVSPDGRASTDRESTGKEVKFITVKGDRFVYECIGIHEVPSRLEIPVYFPSLVPEGYGYQRRSANATKIDGSTFEYTFVKNTDVAHDIIIFRESDTKAPSTCTSDLVEEGGVRRDIIKGSSACYTNARLEWTSPEDTHIYLSSTGPNGFLEDRSEFLKSIARSLERVE